MSDSAMLSSDTVKTAKKHTRWWFGTKLSLVMWAVLGTFLIGYGFVAVDSATTVSPRLNESENQLGQIDYLIEQARNGVSTVGSLESENMSPIWVRTIEKIHSSEYVNGEDAIITTNRHYISMSDGQRERLSLHMILGLALMGFGFFQFWPAFRRRYRKAHRLMGGGYILAGFTSMAMSGSHLLTNEISDIYGEYVFYTGLWVMLVIAVFGMSAAIYAIYRRNIAAHLGWQALAFGTFLTAPLQRTYWIGMSPFAGDATFNEMNMLVNVSLFAQAFLVAYALFYINRTSSPVRGAMRAHSGIVEAGSTAKMIGYAITAIAAVFLLNLYMFSPGYATSDFAAYMVPASAAAWHDEVITASALRYVLVLAVMIQLVVGMRLFLASEQGVRSQTMAPMVIVAGGVISGGILISWGYQLGMPRHEISLAGVFYFYAGILQWLLGGFFAAQVWRQQLGKMREALCLVLGMAMAPAIMSLGLWGMAMADTVPPIYREAGHGYLAAASFGLFLPITVGHLYAMFSAETKRYAVN
ncbi:MAG: DUF2306 domain-containing protein [Marinobacter sp.]